MNFRKGQQVLVELIAPEDNSFIGNITEGFKRGDVCLVNAVAIEGHTPQRADGEIWIPRENVAWMQDASSVDLLSLKRELQTT